MSKKLMSYHLTSSERSIMSCLRSLSAGNAADVQPQDDDKTAE